MTESGRACAVHGLMECPGYKMIETSAQDKLYQRHQELRKKSGLPNPNYYKELKKTFDLPDEERHVAVAALKRKYKIDEAGPFSYGAKKPRKGSVADLAAKKRKEQEKDRQPIEPKDHMVGVAKVIKGVAEDNIDDRLTAQYNTPQMKAKSQSIDQAFASGNQQDFDRLGIISPQQIERDYQAMRAKEPAQDAALYANPKLTPGARAGSTFKTNPRGVPMKEKYDVEEDSSYMDTNPGSVTAQQAQDFDDAAKRAFKPKYYNNDNEPAPKKRDWDYSDPEIAPLVKDWMNKNLIDRKPLTAPARNKDSIDESIEQYLEELSRAGYEVITETAELCPECGGPAFADRMLAEKQDACYHKVKSRYKVWPSAYASGALVRCRKVGAKNWGNKSKK